MIFYLLPVAAYLIGSVSSAIVVTRLMGLQDPRKVGSQNPGATNVLRYGGKAAAAVTLVGDVFKGVIPVVLARVLGAGQTTIALVMLAAFLGHLYPVFHGFRGGKGVATALGVISAVNIWVGLLLMTTWVVMSLLFRYSSLSAITAAILAPVYVWWRMPVRPILIATSIIVVLLLWRHRSNIRKLVAGTESRIHF
ncbi:MAG: glycerol-3-phosphate 1-O-acyltransferase PlsY [Gammaproteobacteria bacterium]|nr:glycerol-3-phosphate 1-O-acyltransferase PlsY [Gammaproteobacteria bacterium]